MAGWLVHPFMEDDGDEEKSWPVDGGGAYDEESGAI